MKIRNLMLLGMVLCASVIVFTGDKISSPDRLDEKSSALPEALFQDPAIPLSFIPNRGQAAAAALFYAKASRYTLWLTKSGLVFDSLRREAAHIPGAEPGGAGWRGKSWSRDVLRLSFPGARPDPEVVSAGPAPFRVNSYTGGNPAAWRTGIQPAKAVLYKSLYPGIDLKVYGVEAEVEYDWVVSPGGDPASIRLACQGMESASLDARGDLVIRTRFRTVTHRRPQAYQIRDGARVDVKTGFRQTADGVFGFILGAYDRTLPLTIDPVVLVSSSYLGGSLADMGAGVAADASGSIYIAGLTMSADFPATAGLDVSLGGSYDAFIAKFGPDGKTLLYATYFGGVGTDVAEALALDKDGNPIIAGETDSPNLPAKNAFDSTLNGGYDALIAKFAAEDGSLVFGTYLGGAGDEVASEIAVDANGAVCLCGCTKSRNFPVKKAYNPKPSGEWDAWVCKMDGAGKKLLWSTYLGGSASEYGLAALAVDGAGSVYVTGSTNSSKFPTTSGAFDRIYNGKSDAYVVKFAPSGQTLSYATFLGGTGYDWPRDIAVDKTGAAVVVGNTDSNFFPLKNAYDATRNGGEDGFLTKIGPSGGSLRFSTFIGGKHDDYASKVVLDETRTIFIAGSTYSSDFPVLNPVDKTLGGIRDVVVMKFDALGTGLLWSTYLGGSGQESATGIALDGSGMVYISGVTDSQDFPVKKAFETSFRGELDAFFIRLSETRSSSRFGPLGSRGRARG